MNRTAILGTAIESSGAKRGADEVKGALDGISASATRASASVKAATTAVTKSVQDEAVALRQVTSALTTTTAATSSLTAAQTAQKASLNEIFPELQQMRSQLDAAGRQLNATATGQRAMASATATATAATAASVPVTGGATVGLQAFAAAMTARTAATTAGAAASRLFTTALGAMGGPLGVILTGLTALPIILDKIEEGKRKAARETENYRESLEKLSPAARESAVALEQAFQAQLRSERRTSLGDLRERDRLIAESETRITELRRASTDAANKAAREQEKVFAGQVRETENVRKATILLRQEGELSAKAFLAAASTWERSFDSSRSFARALAELSPEAIKLRDSALEAARAQKVLEDQQNAGTRAAKEARDAKRALAAAEREADRENKQHERTLRDILGILEDKNEVLVKQNALWVASAKSVEEDRKAVEKAIKTRKEFAASALAAKENEAFMVGLRDLPAAQREPLRRAYLEREAADTYGFTPEQAKRFVDAQYAIDAANRKTREWYDSLRDVAGVVQLIAAGLGERNVAQAATGAQSLFSGIQRANSLTDKAGNAVSFGTALSGGAGLSGFLGAAGGAGAIVGGIVQIGQALDLFGERAREEARVLRERAKTFNAALAEFGQGERTALGGALQTNLNNALQLARGSGYTGGGFFSSADIDAAARETFRKAFDDLKNVNKEMLLLSDQLTRLADAVRKNEAVITERLAFEERLARGELDTRKLRAQGADEEAAALARQLAGQKEVRDAVLRFGADSAYVAHLKEVLQIEEAAAQAIALRTAEQRAFDTRMGNAGLTARLLGAQGDPMADELRAYIQAEQELRDAREKGLDIALLVAAQEAERMQRRVQQEQEAQQKQLGYAAREAALTNSINAQLIQKAAQWQAELNALSPTDTAGRERVNTLNQAEWERMRAGFRSQADSLMGGYAMGAEGNAVTRAVMQATLDRANAEKQLKEYLDAGIISQREYADTLENVNITTRRAIEEAKRAQERDRIGFEADTAARRASLNPMDRFAAKAAYDQQGFAEYQAAYDNALKLRDAGTITNDMFVNFVAILNQQFSPAVRDAAWATAEAARIMGQNLSTLQQQWGVFGTDADGQLSDLTGLYGFSGMTPAQIQALFTKVTPGQELSATQLQTNDQVANWWAAYRRSQAAQAPLDTPAGSVGGAATMPSWNPGRMADPMVLGGDSVTMRSAASMTETSATRLIDFASAQLSVQREILAELRGRRSQSSDLLGPALVDRLDRAFGTRAADSDLLLNGRVS